MAEGDGTVYNNFKEQCLVGTIDLSNAADVIKCILVAAHTPSLSDIQYSDVIGDEESGTGYSAGGETLANQAVKEETSTNRASFDADNVTWTGLDVGTPSHAIIYDDTPATKYLIAYFELATASNGGDYTLSWHLNGILLLT